MSWWRRKLTRAGWPVFEGGQGRDRSHRIGLGFFPAKSRPPCADRSPPPGCWAGPTHPPPCAGWTRGCWVEEIHLKVALSIRNCPRRLGLQVEMVLPVHVHFPLPAHGLRFRRLSERCLGYRGPARCGSSCASIASGIDRIAGKRLVLNLDLLSTKAGRRFPFRPPPRRWAGPSS